VGFELDPDELLPVLLHPPGSGHGFGGCGQPGEVGEKPVQSTPPQSQEVLVTVVEYVLVGTGSP